MVQRERRKRGEFLPPVRLVEEFTILVEEETDALAQCGLELHLEFGEVGLARPRALVG